MRRELQTWNKKLTLVLGKSLNIQLNHSFCDFSLKRTRIQRFLWTLIVKDLCLLDGYHLNFSFSLAYYNKLSKISIAKR